jgi:hypothetical protein
VDSGVEGLTASELVAHGNLRRIGYKPDAARDLIVAKRPTN